MESYLGKYAEISSIAIYTDHSSVSSYKQIHFVGGMTVGAVKD